MSLKAVRLVEMSGLELYFMVHFCIFYIDFVFVPQAMIRVKLLSERVEYFVSVLVLQFMIESQP